MNDRLKNMSGLIAAQRAVQVVMNVRNITELEAIAELQDMAQRHSMDECLKSLFQYEERVRTGRPMIDN